jgi:hypothetical protein
MRPTFTCPRQCLLLCGLLGCAMARADDVRDLEEELPVTIEDARPSPAGSRQFNGGLRYQHMRPSPGAGREEWQLTPRFQLGITDDLQMAIASPYRLGDSSDSSQGEARLEGLLRLNRERGNLPSFAVDVGVEQPFGANHGGTEALIKGIMTKSLGQSRGTNKVAQVHVNLIARHNFNPLPDERLHRYMAGVAFSRQLSERWLVGASLFSEEQRQRGQVINMVEFGARWKLSEKLVFSGGFGYGFNGPVQQRLLLGFQLSLD